MTRNPRKISLIGSRTTSVLSISLVLIILGLCGTLGYTVHRAGKAVGDDTSIMITLLPDESPLRSSELKRHFKEQPWVLRYDFNDATTVLTREIENLDNSSRQALELLPDNPFGDEFVLHLNEGWRNSDSIDVLTRRLEILPGVDIVSGDASALGRANDGLRRVMLYMGILAVILLVISIALINNTISLSIYSRRFNIHTMRLVGATNAFIRRPFVRAGMMTGFIAGVLAMVVVTGIQLYLMLNDRLVGEWINVDLILITAVVLVVAGMLLARAAAWCAATNYLKKSYDNLFKK